MVGVGCSRELCKSSPDSPELRGITPYPGSCSRAEFRTRLFGSPDGAAVAHGADEDRDQAFSQKNVAAYTPRVVHHVEKLISVIDALGGKEVEAAPIFNFFSYDV